MSSCLLWEVRSTSASRPESGIRNYSARGQERANSIRPIQTINGPTADNSIASKVTRLYQGDLSLPGKGLLVTTEALGHAYNGAFVLGGATFTITLPKPPRPADGDQLQSPMPENPNLGDPWWGAITRTHRHASVRAVVLQASIDESKFEGDQYLQPQFDAWYTTLARWVECWTRQSVEDAHDKAMDFQVSGNLTALSPDSPEPMIPFWGYMPKAHVPDPDAVATPVQLRAACARASVDQKPPAEWIALTNAERSENNRIAVIEAATAAEIALAGAIERRLPQVHPKGVDTITHQANGAVGLLDLVTGLSNGNPGPVSRGRVMDQLAGPRNRAVHSGTAPTDDQRRRAIETARALLNEYSPLPSW